MAEPKTVINFKESCVDPLAKIVFLEAISFALDKAESRLESLGKIFPGIQDLGRPVLDDIKEIRFGVENLTVCAVPGTTAPGPASVVEPPPPAAIKQFPKHEQELIKQMPPHLQTALAMELSRKPGEAPKTPDFYVGGKGITAPVKKESEQEKKERTQPTSWGELEYKGLSYSSPGYFLSQLHGGDVSKIRGKGNYIRQLDADGFNVYIGDKLVPPDIKKEDLEKLKGVGMRVEAKKGKTIPLPSGGKPLAQPAGSYPGPWTIVTGGEGIMLAVEDMNGKQIPEVVWRALSGDELDKLAPRTRKASSASARAIPGLPVRGGKVLNV